MRDQSKLLTVNKKLASENTDFSYLTRLNKF